jgi:hypothetical protein
MKRLPTTHVRSIEHDVLSRNGDVLTIVISENSKMMYSILVVCSITIYDAKLLQLLLEAAGVDNDEMNIKHICAIWLLKVKKRELKKKK